jgi:hypothetical protein
MSKVIVTAQSDLSTLPAKVRRDLGGAYSALRDLEPTPARLLKAAEKVGVLRFTHGVSVRGVVAIMSAYGQGTLPAGKGTIERLGYVAEGIAGEWPTTPEDADADTIKADAEAKLSIVADLYRIAQIGNAADVTRAADLGRKSPTLASASAQVGAVKGELNAAQHKSLTTAPTRQVGGNAGDGGNAPQAPQAPAQGTEGAQTPQTPQGDGQTPHAPHTVQSALSAATLGALIAEATARAAAEGFTPDADLQAAFDILAATFTEAAERAQAATPKPRAPRKATAGK